MAKPSPEGRLYKCLLVDKLEQSNRAHGAITSNLRQSQTSKIKQKNLQYIISTLVVGITR
jgi:hypothetical protein